MPGDRGRWVRADAGVYETSGLVSQWADQSGANNHLAPPTTGNQPLFHEHIYGPATQTVPPYVERVLAGNWKN
jgi:hypothetical protein